MNIYEDTNPRELKELLHQIHTGDTVLPDFQRDFVWDPSMTTELIISIACNYPAGSLLRIRNTQNYFASREFEGAPKLNGRKPIYLVLDGQQRLTSLYQAFYGVGDNLFYVDLKGLIAGKDFEDCIFNLGKKHPRVEAYQQLDNQAKDLVLPLSILEGGNGSYTQWIRNVSRLQTDDKKRITMEDNLYSVDGWIQTIDDYKFPVVTLTDSTSAEAVCTIFETLNRTGVKLSPFELLTARFWPLKVNLRNLWNDAKEDYPKINDFLIDPYYILQIISLISKGKPSIKRSEVMNLKKEAIDNYWGLAIDGLKEALAFLQSESGILTPGLLPYTTIVIPMAAMFVHVNTLKGPSIGAAKDKISRWLWCAIFGQKYESSPTSQSASDYSEVIDWINGGSESETVSTFRFDPLTLSDTTPRQRAVYRGTLALVLRHRSQDFHSREPLTLEVISQRHVDDHHIFPNKYLERKGVNPRLRDCVLNHTLIDRDTNNIIRDRAPSDYLQEICSARGESKFIELLNSHLLPFEKDSPLLSDDFETFLSWRQEKLFQEIKHLTGI